MSIATGSRQREGISCLSAVMGVRCAGLSSGEHVGECSLEARAPAANPRARAGQDQRGSARGCRMRHDILDHLRHEWELTGQACTCLWRSDRCSSRS